MMQVLEEKKKKSDKERMKCNSPRRIRQGEAGHGTKKFVVKACDGGTEKIIRYGTFDTVSEVKEKLNTITDRDITLSVYTEANRTVYREER